MLLCLYQFIVTNYLYVKVTCTEALYQCAVEWLGLGHYLYMYKTNVISCQPSEGMTFALLLDYPQQLRPYPGGKLFIARPGGMGKFDIPNIRVLVDTFCI